MFSGYKVDVFFHFWDTIDAQEKEDIVALLKPRAYRFETPRDFSALDHDPLMTPDRINVPSRVFSQYASWCAVAELVEPFHADYTFAMRARADLQFVYGIHHILPQLKPQDIVIPWWDADEHLLSDLFALGGIEPILYFHRLYDHVHDYLEGRCLNPELMLTTHFEKRPDFHLYTETFRYFFVRRPHMAGYSVEKAIAENPGRNKWLDPEVTEAHAAYHTQKKQDKGLFIKTFRDRQLALLTEKSSS